jgi:serine protease DegQ
MRIPAPPSATQRRSRSGLVSLAMVLLLVGACTPTPANETSPSVATSATDSVPGPASPPPTVPQRSAGSVTQDATPPGSSRSGPAGEPLPIPDLVAQVQPSVVTIVLAQGSGSGVVYGADGLVLTNEHVVRGATNVQVAFADGQRVAGRVTAVDVLTDLALVQADRTDLPPAEFETALPRVGETAIVIGSPLGFENSATAGIISGLHRDIPGSASNSQSLVDLIQTDAAISPGNSGGALINAAGKVIGISEAYIPPQSGAVSLGFAIPAATAVQVADQLREDGTAEHAFVGLVPATITPQIAQQLGRTGTQGVVVLSTVPGGPAAAAGLLAGDVLLSLDDDALISAEDLLAGLRRYRPGDVINLGVERNGQRLDVSVTVIDRPAG